MENCEISSTLSMCTGHTVSVGDATNAASGNTNATGVTAGRLASGQHDIEHAVPVWRLRIPWL